MKINEALERYGAKTCGTLERRVERLKRFTELKNKQYAGELRVEDARMIANQEREDRVKNRIRELQSAPVFLRRNLKRSFDEVAQEVEIPMTPSRYNLRSRPANYGMDLLAAAIENGFVKTRRG